MQDQNDLIFALDIGTRTIVGLVMKFDEPVYKIIASKVIEHENRAMLDGQIHNVNEVARQAKRVKDALEKDLNIKLERVSIAAAGRSLKTVIVDHSLDLSTSKIIDSANVKTLEFSAIQKAKEKLAKSDPDNNLRYNFVGYSIIEYNIDGMFLRELTGQRGKTIDVKLVATFLPRIVIDSLLSVINKINLKVEYLTLEPIAAADVVIPRNMLSFNLALVDIGAGTSDIALTKGGAMIGYDMVPIAGDEITEVIAEHYLLAYEEAEKIKCMLVKDDDIDSRTILGQEITISSEEALNTIRPRVKELVELITEKVININGKPPQAVLCIGGGSLTPLLVSELTAQLELPENRVGIKDSEDLKNVTGNIDDINSTQSLTPIGIAVSSHNNKEGSNFYNIKVNDSSVQIFSIKQPTISEALLAANINIKDIRPGTGMGITCTVNGRLKTIKGTLGEAGRVYLNGEQAGLNKSIKSGDSIKFKSGKEGKDAQAKIRDVIDKEVMKSTEIQINGKSVKVKPHIYQNGKLVDFNTSVIDGADITYKPLKKIKDAVAQVMELSIEKITNSNIKFTLNGEKKLISKSNYLIKEGKELIDPEKPLQEGMNLEVKDNDKKSTIADVLPELKGNGIQLKFNNSQLNIPNKKTIIKVNGEEVDIDYKIENGDHITVKFNKYRVKDVLEYINYNLSAGVKEKVQLKINDMEADFNNYVNDGDKISIKFKRFSSK